MARRGVKRKAEDALWNEHKQTLEHLFVSEKRKTEDVRTIMAAAPYNFVRSCVDHFFTSLSPVTHLLASSGVIAARCQDGWRCNDSKTALPLLIISRHSTAQLERVKAKLGIRKNIKQDDWKLIRCHVDTRHAGGKRSLVIVNGERISDEKLGKSIKRYSHETVFDRFKRGKRARPFYTYAPPY